MDLHLLCLIDSLSRSGAEMSLASMAPHWVKAGVNLDIAYFHEREGLQEELVAAGANLFPLGTDGGRWSWSRQVTALLRNRTPDLIHSTLFESDLAARVAGTITATPTVSSLVNLAYGPEQRAEGSSVRRIKLRAAQAVDAASAVSVRRFHAISGVVARMMSRRMLIPSNKIEVIPRGRDPALMGSPSPSRRAAARARLSLQDSDLLILAGARQEYQKGLDILLRAFPLVQDALPKSRLVIAGREGNQTPLLQDLAATARRDVTFLGMRSDIPDLLCAADVWVEPSRWEGGPGAMLEAMAMEAPIVASDLPVYEGAVENRVSALLVPAEKPELLAHAIVEALSDRRSALDRAQAARQRFFDVFTVERVAKRLLEFHGRALRRSEPPFSST